jgi:hypothetical protein
MLKGSVADCSGSNAQEEKRSAYKIIKISQHNLGKYAREYPSKL